MRGRAFLVAIGRVILLFVVMALVGSCAFMAIQFGMQSGLFGFVSWIGLVVLVFIAIRLIKSLIKGGDTGTKD